MEAALKERLEAQRVVQAALREVMSELVEGVTEAEAAAILRARLVEAGAAGFFHEPVVWFGERTALKGMRGHSDAMPGARVLAAGDPVLMDVAPLMLGLPVDVTYTGCLGECPALEEGRAVLRGLRESIPAWVNEGRTRREITLLVEEVALAANFKSRQKAYLFGAIGHRLFGAGMWPFGRRSGFGLGLGSSIQLFGSALLHRVTPGLVAWPFWNDSPRSETRPGLGLWSVEPHIARGDVGVKWEELLLVEEEGARWLEPEEPLL